MSSKEFKIAVLKKFSDLEENTKQLNEIRKTIHEQNEKFNWEIDIIKKEQNRNSRTTEYNE